MARALLKASLLIWRVKPLRIADLTSSPVLRADRIFWSKVSPEAIAHRLHQFGSGATLVNRDFWLGHPELFEPIGTSAGTDGQGQRAETPLLLMAESAIGQRAFGRHQAVAVDLSGVNRTLEYPMDLILGYPTIRQADWLFDFPAKRWALTS